MKRLYYTLDGTFRELKPVEECPPFAEDTNYPFMDVADSVEEQHITFAAQPNGLYFPVIDSPYYKYPVTAPVEATTPLDTVPVVADSTAVTTEIANSLIAAAMDPATADSTREYLKSLLKEVISEISLTDKK